MGVLSGYIRWIYGVYQMGILNEYIKREYQMSILIGYFKILREMYTPLFVICHDK